MRAVLFYAQLFLAMPFAFLLIYGLIHVFGFEALAIAFCNLSSGFLMSGLILSALEMDSVIKTLREGGASTVAIRLFLAAGVIGGVSAAIPMLAIITNMLQWENWRYLTVVTGLIPPVALVFSWCAKIAKTLTKKKACSTVRLPT